jgi:hypothetical protein
MHEGSYLLYRPGNKLGEAFVVTQLVEEVVTINDDKLPPLNTETGQKTQQPERPLLDTPRRSRR